MVVTNKPLKFGKLVIGMSVQFMHTNHYLWSAITNVAVSWTFEGTFQIFNVWDAGVSFLQK